MVEKNILIVKQTTNIVLWIFITRTSQRKTNDYLRIYSKTGYNGAVLVVYNNLGDLTIINACF